MRRPRCARTLAAGETPRPDTSGEQVLPAQICRLFYVSDTHTGTHFLVDTGSKVSTIPPSPPDCRHSPDKLTLMGVNDTPIHTYSKRSLTLNLGLHPLDFYHRRGAETRADFVRHFGLLVEMKQHQLVDAATYLYIQGVIFSHSSHSPSICPKDTRNPYLNLLSGSH